MITFFYLLFIIYFTYKNLNLSEFNLAYYFCLFKLDF